MKTRGSSAFSGRAALPFALFCAAAVFAVLVTWPLAAHCGGSFISHWDPPFHAWKLEWMARRIVAGDLSFSGGDTNHVSPWSGTLFYEALQLPPAFPAAAAFALFPGISPVLVYNLSLFAFWALGAPCWYFLARRLGCSREASAFSSFAFCALPWRVSYAPEFQMELVFAIPLFLGAVAGFFRTLRARDAALAAAAWWLLAVSELYEAVTFALVAPFVVAALAARDPGLFAKRRFWTGAAAAFATGAVSLFAWLSPYLVQRGGGAVQRSFSEVRRHAAQPLSYLVPYGRFAPWTIEAKEDELSLWPTFCILGLATFAAAAWMRSASRGPRSADGASGRVRRAFALAAVAAAACSAAAFFAVAAAVRPGDDGSFSACLYAWSAVAVAVCSLALAAASPRGESLRSAFVRGLAAASAFFVVMSCGPALTAGRKAAVVAANPVYWTLREGPLSMLSGFRVVSRFGVVPLVALLCAAGLGFDALFSRIGSRRVRAALAVVAALLVAAEAVPLRGPGPVLRSVPDLRASPAAARFVAARPDCTVVDLPTGQGNRWSDAERKFSLIRGDWPCTWAWGGYFPPAISRIESLSNSGDWEWFRHLTLAWYPKPVVVLDKHPKTLMGLHHESGREAWRPGCHAPVPAAPPTAEDLSGIARVVDEDDSFVFLELLPEPPQRECRKLLRTSLVREKPVAAAVAKAAPGTLLKVSLNGKGVARETAGPDGVVDLRMDLSAVGDLEKTEPNILYFRAAGTNRFDLVSFDLLPK